jgi:hypothetical protein
VEKAFGVGPDPNCHHSKGKNLLLLQPYNFVPTINYEEKMTTYWTSKINQIEYFLSITGRQPFFTSNTSKVCNDYLNKFFEAFEDLASKMHSA